MCVVYILQLLKTGEEVAKLQADLEEMRPQLEKAQIETEQTMAKIEKDSGTVCSILYYIPLTGILSFFSFFFFILLFPLPSLYSHTYIHTHIVCTVHMKLQLTTLDAAIAKETKEVVQKEEEEATVKAQRTQEIADSAQRDLDEALPALVLYMLTFIISLQLGLSSPELLKHRMTRTISRAHLK